MRALLLAALIAVPSHGSEPRTARASWYGEGHRGCTTASGEAFDPDGFTAASRTHPLGAFLVLSYRGRVCVVRVNDRGPGILSRDLDLSRAAARFLGFEEQGLADLQIDEVTL